MLVYQRVLTNWDDPPSRYHPLLKLDIFWSQSIFKGKAKVTRFLASFFWCMIHPGKLGKSHGKSTSVLVNTYKMDAFPVFC